jgi:hypothetical protein
MKAIDVVFFIIMTTMVQSDKIVIIVEQVNSIDVTQTFNDDCVICLEPFVDNQQNANQLEVTLACGHKFHSDCIQPVIVNLLQQNTDITCPICRANVMNTAHHAYIEARRPMIPSRSATTIEYMLFVLNVLSRVLILVLISTLCLILATLLVAFTMS